MRCRSTWIAVVLSVASATSFAAPRMDRSRFHIGVYCVNSNLYTEAHVRELADCGVDLVLPVPVRERQFLDWLHKYGMGCAGLNIIPSGWMTGEKPGHIREVRPKAVCEKDLAEFMSGLDHPAIWMTDLCDEPHAGDMPYLRELVELLADRGPDIPAYVNLFPSYALSINESPARAIERLGAPNYEAYLDIYRRTLPLDYLSFDFYPYHDVPSISLGRVKMMYDNLRLAANICRESGRSLWFIAQLNTRRDCKERLTVNKLRFQAFVSMAFGAEVLSWGCWCPGWWLHNVYDKDGVRDDAQYEKVRTVNHEVLRVADPYMKFRNEETVFVGTAQEKPAYDDGRFCGLRAEDGSALVVGRMSPRDGSRAAAAFVVGVADPLDRQRGTHRVVFRADGEVAAIGPTGKIPLECLQDGRCAFSLDDSSCALLVTRPVAVTRAEGKPADVFAFPPPGAVKLKGVLGDAIARCERGWVLGDVPYEEFASFFAKGHPKYATGEMWGKYMRSACRYYRECRNPEVRRRVDQCLAAILKTQRENGSISCAEIGSQPDGPGGDLWERKYVMLGLEAYYEDVCRDPRVLESLKRQADCIMAQIGPHPKADVRDLGWSPNHIESSTLLEPFVVLHRLTGEKRYLDFAGYLFRAGGAKKYDLVKAAHDGVLPHRMGGVYPKAYETTSYFEGLAEYVRMTGDAYAKSAVNRYFEMVLTNELTIAGNGGADLPYHPRVCGEGWGHTAFEQGNPHVHRMMETCTGVTWLKFASHILRMNGDVRAVEAIERYAYNGLIGAMKPDGAGFSYVNLLNGEKTTDTGWGWNFGERRVTCCNLNGPMGLAYLPSLAIMTSREGPIINLYESLDCTLATPSGSRLGMSLDSEFPRGPNATLTVRPATDERFTMRLRIPGWSTRTFVRVNEESEMEAPRGTYLNLDRMWRNGDVVRLRFGLSARLVQAPRGRERAGDPFAAVIWGPIALSRWERDDSGYAAPVDIIANENGEVSVELQASDGRGLAFRVPVTTGGTILMRDYATAGGWQEGKICTWLPKKSMPGTAEPPMPGPDSRRTGGRVLTLEAGRAFARFGGAEARIEKDFPNPFDKRFAGFCLEYCRVRCRPEDGSLVGYFMDAGLDWSGDARRTGGLGLFDKIAALPSDHSARRALVRFVGGRKVTDAVRTEFIRFVAERYYDAFESAIRAAHPNSRVLGGRFKGFDGAPQVVWETLGTYCDAVSVDVPDRAGEPVDGSVGKSLATIADFSRRPAVVYGWFSEVGGGGAALQP